nr:unnamed protein product [Fasciola hepatica]
MTTESSTPTATVSSETPGPSSTATAQSSTAGVTTSSETSTPSSTMTTESGSNRPVIRTPAWISLLISGTASSVFRWKQISSLLTNNSLAKGFIKKVFMEYAQKQDWPSYFTDPNQNSRTIAIVATEEIIGDGFANSV